MDTLKSGWAPHLYWAHFSEKWGNHSKTQLRKEKN